MNDLIHKIAKLPNQQKTGAIVLLYVILAAVYYFVLYVPKVEALEVLETDADALQSEKASTQAIANNLEKFRLEVEELNEELNRALKALPNERNFDKLMTRMENLAKRIGLDVVLLEPRPDVFQDFYAEVPFRLEVSGSYHEIALFFYRLGTMARIVNVKDITMSGGQDKGGKVALNATAMAVTYRFLDEKEREQAKKKKKPKKGEKPEKTEKPAEGD